MHLVGCWGLHMWSGMMIVQKRLTEGYIIQKKRWTPLIESNLKYGILSCQLLLSFTGVGCARPS